MCICARARVFVCVCVCARACARVCARAPGWGWVGALDCECVGCACVCVSVCECVYLCVLFWFCAGVQARICVRALCAGAGVWPGGCLCGVCGMVCVCAACVRRRVRGCGWCRRRRCARARVHWVCRSCGCYSWCVRAWVGGLVGGRMLSSLCVRVCGRALTLQAPPPFPLYRNFPFPTLLASHPLTPSPPHSGRPEPRPLAPPSSRSSCPRRVKVWILL